MKAHSGKQVVRFKGEAYYRCRPLTKDDLMQQDATDKAVDAAIARLKPIVKDNPNKLLANLARCDVEGMVIDAIAACDKRRRELEVIEELNDDISDIGLS